MRHRCTLICDLAKKYYPDVWMKSHGVKAEILVDSFSRTDLGRRAKALKIKCRSQMTIEELSKAIETKSNGGDIKEIEAVARKRVHDKFKKLKLKPKERK